MEHNELFHTHHKYKLECIKLYVSFGKYVITFREMGYYKHNIYVLKSMEWLLSSVNWSQFQVCYVQKDM